MNLLTRWDELIITQDNQKFIKVIALLKDAGIAYKENIQNIGHNNRRSGQIASLGENPKYSNIYQIYVKKTDIEKAKILIRNG